jgi:hypothetical protein
MLQTDADHRQDRSDERFFYFLWHDFSFCDDCGVLSVHDGCIGSADGAVLTADVRAAI